MFDLPAIFDAPLSPARVYDRMPYPFIQGGPFDLAPILTTRVPRLINGDTLLVTINFPLVARDGHPMEPGEVIGIMDDVSTEIFYFRITMKSIDAARPGSTTWSLEPLATPIGGEHAGH